VLIHRSIFNTDAANWKYSKVINPLDVQVLLQRGEECWTAISDSSLLLAFYRLQIIATLAK